MELSETPPTLVFDVEGEAFRGDHFLDMFLHVPAYYHARKGGVGPYFQALTLFPAGGVATARGFRGPIEDLEWKRFVVKVIQMTRATVVPVYVHGRNGRLFQFVSQFSPTLRLALLLNETRNKMGRPVRVTIGDPLPYEALAGFRDRQALLDHLRATVFALCAV